MHKHTAVAELNLDNETAYIQKIGDVFAPEHLPVGVGMKRGAIDRTALNTWWTDRSIPASRSGVREAMETLQITDTKTLANSKTRKQTISTDDEVGKNIAASYENKK